METLDTLARHLGPRGEVVLRRRHRAEVDVEELIVTASSPWTPPTPRRAAGWPRSRSAVPRTARSRVSLRARRGSKGVVPPCSARRVLAGGLGLGFHGCRATRPPRSSTSTWSRSRKCLVEWAYAGLTPTLATVARDPRVALHTADVAAVLEGRKPEPRGPWDAIVLDVDNGPDFLIHETNAGLYTPPLLAAAYAGSARAASWRSGPRDPLRTCSPPWAGSRPPRSPILYARPGRPVAGLRDLHRGEGRDRGATG
jgi:hypothetical protein